MSANDGKIFKGEDYYYDLNYFNLAKLKSLSLMLRYFKIWKDMIQNMKRIVFCIFFEWENNFPNTLLIILKFFLYFI